MQFNFINMRVSREYTVLGEDPIVGIKNAIERGEEIIFFGSLEGARNIHTTIQYNHHVLSVNPNLKGYKLHKEDVHNHFAAQTSTRYFFKKLKSQDQAVYEKYLHEVVAYIEEVLGVKFKQQVFKVYTQAFN